MRALILYIMFYALMFSFFYPEAPKSKEGVAMQFLSTPIDEFFFTLLGNAVATIRRYRYHILLTVTGLLLIALSVLMPFEQFLYLVVSFFLGASFSTLVGILVK